MSISVIYRGFSSFFDERKHYTINKKLLTMNLYEKQKKPFLNNYRYSSGINVLLQYNKGNVWDSRASGIRGIHQEEINSGS